jgi:carbamoyl-phosphate synthase large subunit
VRFHGDRVVVAELAQALRDLGFNLVATRGTAQAIEAAGIPVRVVNKVTEGRPHIVDMIKNGDVDLIVNVVEDKQAVKDSSCHPRRGAGAARVAYFTTLAGARAACMGMQHGAGMEVYSLQSLHKQLH